ncbi:MAG: hypothetical protein R6U51_01490 [Anaerolineales bacterium]
MEEEIRNNVNLKIEFYSEISSVGDDVREEVRDRLEDLAVGHTDIIGASLAVEDIAGEEPPFLYEVRLVLYMRPENIAIVEKGETIRKTITDTLSATERLVRKERTRRKEISHQPVKKEPDELYKASPKELYETYTPSRDPRSLLDKGRSKLASEMMMEEEMEQEAAYYITDIILEYAEGKISAS